MSRGFMKGVTEFHVCGRILCHLGHESGLLFKAFGRYQDSLCNSRKANTDLRLVSVAADCLTNSWVIALTVYSWKSKLPRIASFKREPSLANRHFPALNLHFLPIFQIVYSSSGQRCQGHLSTVIPSTSSLSTVPYSAACTLIQLNGD